METLRVIESGEVVGINLEALHVPPNILQPEIRVETGT